MDPLSVSMKTDSGDNDENYSITSAHTSKLTTTKKRQNAKTKQVCSI